MERGYLAAAGGAVEHTGEAARSLPAAEALDLLMNHADSAPERDTHAIEGHFTLMCVEPGNIWLEPDDASDGACGPIPVPRTASALLAVGWDMEGVIAKTPRGWRLIGFTV